VDHEVEIEVRAEDAGAEIALLPGLDHGGVEDLRLGLVLATDEDEGLVGAGRQRPDDAALDQEVRVALHQQPVLERARLRLVGVAAEVLVHRALGDEAGLLPHREPRAAAATQARGLELLEHLLRGHLRERLAGGLVAAQALVGLHLMQEGLVEVGGEQLELAHTGRPSFQGSR
jgi:hypothetical protein